MIFLDVIPGFSYPNHKAMKGFPALELSAMSSTGDLTVTRECS